MYTCGGEGIIANYKHATLPPVPLQKSGTKNPLHVLAKLKKHPPPSKNSKERNQKLKEKVLLELSIKSHN